MEQKNNPFFTDIENTEQPPIAYSISVELQPNSNEVVENLNSDDCISAIAVDKSPIDAIHIGKMPGNRFERIFIDDDLVNEIVYSVLDYDIPVQTTMIVNLDNDKPIIQYRGYFRRITSIISIFFLLFFVIFVVYIMIFQPK